MYIFIEALTGLKICLNVSPEDTIQNVKHKVMVCEDLPIDEQHLIYQDQELENYKSLSFYEIPHNATIRLIMKMRGGPLSVDVGYEEILTNSPPNSFGDQLALIFLENGELRFLPISGLEMQNKMLKKTKDDLNDQSIFSSFEEPITDQKLTILKLKMDCIRLGKKLSNMSRQDNSKIIQINNENNQTRANKPINTVLHRSVSLDSRPSEFIHETSNCINKFKSSHSSIYSSKSPPTGIYRTTSVLDTIKLKKCSISIFPPVQNLSKINQKPIISETLLVDNQIVRSNYFESLQKLPPLNESENENKKNISKKPRCPICLKKMSLTNEFICRCGGHFCSKHKYPEEHSCKYDFKYNGKLELIKSNPTIEATKIAKI